MIYVDVIDPLELIPKKQILVKLEKEAPDFLAEILKIEIPPSNDRLNVPVIVTHEKTAAEQINMTPLQLFIEDMCEPSIGFRIKYSDFYDHFAEWSDVDDLAKWTKMRVGRELPPQYPKGRSTKSGQFYVGNIWWKGRPPDEPQTGKYILANGSLVASK